ncbi:hypothetical protein BC834DRAFT_887548 [Gloeopeniophorella convolvens]|nr:hypothetical protein BC834DRAFT_887548 [Gloeopeniophorella convolvens]
MATTSKHKERRPLYELASLDEFNPHPVDGSNANTAGSIALLDTVLLEVFDFYRFYVLRQTPHWKHHHWLKLTHVSRQWREVVFSFPSRLRLCLFCTPESHAIDLINHFPALPLIIEHPSSLHAPHENILYALRHASRARKIAIHAGDSESIFRTLATMDKPAEELEDLELFLTTGVSAATDNFLGGQAPRLRRFCLMGVTIIPLSALLSPMPNLTSLDLFISDSALQPGDLLVQLPAMRKLESLSIRLFPSHTRGVRIIPRSSIAPLQTRLRLPRLDDLRYSGRCQWLEEFMPGVDLSAISNLGVVFHDDPPASIFHFGQFVARSEILRPTSIVFRVYHADTSLVALVQESTSRVISFRFKNDNYELQMDSVFSVCEALTSSFSSVSLLKIEFNDPEMGEERQDTDHAHWHTLLSSFRSVQTLVLCSVPQQSVALWLGPSADQAFPSDMLPNLTAVVLEDFDTDNPMAEALEPFLAERERASRPVSMEFRRMLRRLS